MTYEVEELVRTPKKRKLNSTSHINSNHLGSEPSPLLSQSINNPLSRTSKRLRRELSLTPSSDLTNGGTTRVQKKGVYHAPLSESTDVSDGVPEEDIAPKPTTSDPYDDIENAHNLRPPSKRRSTLAKIAIPYGELAARQKRTLQEWRTAAGDGIIGQGDNEQAIRARETDTKDEACLAEASQPPPSSGTPNRTLRRRTRQQQRLTAVENVSSSVPSGRDALGDGADLEGTRQIAGKIEERSPPTIPKPTSSKPPSKGKERKPRLPKYNGNIEDELATNEVVVNGGRDQAGEDAADQVPPVQDTEAEEVVQVRGTQDSTESLQPGSVDVAEGAQHPKEAFALLQQILMQKLTGKRAIPLTGLDDEYRKVHTLVRQTVIDGEGNSMLVIGARGSGKTALVNSVLAELSTEYREHFHVVRLNGFIHTDDKLALCDIWRQLGRDTDAEDADTLGRNYADTLATLLALLSHPGDSDDANANAAHVSKSVVFVIDEFHLFAAHARQTLLYNLFDIAQSRKAPIAVLGLTTKVNVAEMLEKRVKSRFSHRSVHLSLPCSVAAFERACKAALRVEAGELGFEERSVLKTALSATMQTQTQTHKRRSGAGDNAQPDLLATWNASVESLFAARSFKMHLATIYHRTKSVPEFLASALITIASLSLSLSGGHPLLLPSAFNTTSSLAPPDSNLHLLPALSDVELALLIAAARLDVVCDTDTCTFDMAYDEYVSLAAKARVRSGAAGAGGVRVWGREVALAAWERLARYELVLPVSGVGGGEGGAAQVGRQGRMWSVDVGLEEIGPAVGKGLGGVMARWCREI